MNWKILNVTITIVYLIVINQMPCHARKLTNYESEMSANAVSEDKQFLSFLKSKEASPQGFVRLLLMRLVYGLAAQMGIEERLADLFNGAFVPPNADEDLGFDFGLGDDGDSGGGLFGGGGGGVEELFDFDI